MIARYLAISDPFLLLLMAIIPFASLVAGTARVAAAEGVVATLANAVLDDFCAQSDDFEEWEAVTREGATGALARVAQPITRALRNQYCPLSPPPRQPLAITGSVYGVGGDSRGRLGVIPYYRFDEPGAEIQYNPEASVQWDCGQNRGLPIAQPVEAATPNGRIGLFVQLKRADGSTYFESFLGERPGNAPGGFIITVFDITPCDPTIPVIIPPGVRLEPPIPPVPTPQRPQIPITINLPQLPGLPPIAIPIVYAPITPTLSLEPRITLRPTINLPGFPAIAPDITLDLGGISIGGGGDVTIGDIENIVNESGGDCPDPCPELDYELIRQINYEELDKKFPPARPTVLSEQTYPSQESNSITLPLYSEWVEIEVDVIPPNTRSQFGGDGAPDVYYVGWYSFGCTEFASERIPLNYLRTSIPVPRGARQFSYTVHSLGSAKLKVGYLQTT